MLHTEAVQAGEKPGVGLMAKLPEGPDYLIVNRRRTGSMKEWLIA
jgi:hypothetical protein